MTTPTKLLQFVGGGYLYTFPSLQQSIRDNFANVVPRTVRLPGVSGGFDQYGAGIAPVEIGNVQASFWLEAQSRGEMQALRDQVKAMAFWGVQRLYIAAGNQSPRFCYARVSNINIPMRPEANTDLFQQVQIDFQVAEPYWLELGTETWAWGDGTLWGTAPWGGASITHTLTTTSNDLTETVSGIAPTLPRMTLFIPAGASVTDVTIQRLTASTVQDEISYTGTINGESTLEINCRQLSVKVNGANAYTSAFDWYRPSWFHLLPGLNDIRVTFASKTGSPAITFRYYTRW